jgi:hypothetical protein
MGVEERGEEDLGLTHPFSLPLQFFFSFLMVGLATCFLLQHLMVARINSQGEFFLGGGCSCSCCCG